MCEAWQKIKKARDSKRMRGRQLINRIITNNVPIVGDQYSSDDQSTIAGIGLIQDIKILYLCYDKGLNIHDRASRNFGMCQPSGFRKMLRALKLASRFKIPVLAVIDTPGADISKESEREGQAWWISEVTSAFIDINVPTCSLILSEGNSGGAITLAAADRLIMMENAYFSVISPEGCASIIAKDIDKVDKYAFELRCMSNDLYEQGLIDEVIAEGDSFSSHDETLVRQVKERLVVNLQSIIQGNVIKDKRYNRFLERAPVT
jgi:acetyl-CoA carboxylase carboxyl transferase alpha subunit